jgi:hypothetical protein
MLLRKHRHPFLGKQLHFQLVHDGERDFVLNGENVRHSTVKSLGPEMKTVAGVNQLGRDPESIAHLLYAALQDRVDVQQAPDLADVDFPASK